MPESASSELVKPSLREQAVNKLASVVSPFKARVTEIARPLGNAVQSHLDNEFVQSLEEQGLTPQKADQAFKLVDWFERNARVTDFSRRVNTEYGPQYAETSYRFSSAEIPSLIKLFKTVEDPNRLLREFSKIARMGYGFGVKEFSKLFCEIGSLPGLEAVMLGLAKIKNLQEISPSLIEIISKENGRVDAVYGYAHDPLGRPRGSDTFTHLSQLPSDEISSLFSESAIERLNQFLNPKAREGRTRERKVDIRNVTELLRLAQNPEMFQIFSEAIDSRFGSYLSEEDLTLAIKNFKLAENYFPEITDLQRQGFQVSDIVNPIIYPSYRSEKIETEFPSYQEFEDYLRTTGFGLVWLEAKRVVSDKTFCQNASFLHQQFGIRIKPAYLQNSQYDVNTQTFINSPMFYETEPLETISSALQLFRASNRLFGLEEIKDSQGGTVYEYPRFLQYFSLARELIENYPRDDLQAIFASLEDKSLEYLVQSESQETSVIVANMIMRKLLSFQEKEKIVSAIKTLASQENAAIVKNSSWIFEEFRTIYYPRTSAGENLAEFLFNGSSVVDQLQKLKSLEGQKDYLIEAKKTVTEENWYLPTDIDINLLVLLADTPLTDLQKAITFLNKVTLYPYSRSLDYEKLQKSLILSSLPNEELLDIGTRFFGLTRADLDTTRTLLSDDTSVDCLMTILNNKEQLIQSRSRLYSAIGIDIVKLSPPDLSVKLLLATSQNPNLLNVIKALRDTGYYLQAEDLDLFGQIQQEPKLLSTIKRLRRGNYYRFEGGSDMFAIRELTSNEGMLRVVLRLGRSGYRFQPDDLSAIRELAKNPKLERTISKLQSTRRYNFSGEDLPAIIQVTNNIKLSRSLPLLIESGYTFDPKDVSALTVLCEKPQMVKFASDLLKLGFLLDDETASVFINLFPKRDELLSLMEENESFRRFLLETIEEFDRELLGRIDYRLLSEINSAAPVLAQEILERENPRLRELILSNWDAIATDRSDLEFLNRVVINCNEFADSVIADYLAKLQSGELTRDKKGDFLNGYGIFGRTHTHFSAERKTQIDSTLNSRVGKAYVDIIKDVAVREQMILDLACFSARGEIRKVNAIIEKLREGISSSELINLHKYLRWLPETAISSEDDVFSLSLKYQDSLARMDIGFAKVFSSALNEIRSPRDTAQLNSKLASISEMFGIPTRILITSDGMSLGLPEEFIRTFNQKRRQGSDVHLIPELVRYLIEKVVNQSTAYTVEDLIYSQIGDTEDMTGRRRGRYTAEVLFEAMEENIEASLRTWDSAFRFQSQKPDSPVFIIANERTGPADLAAEYLPAEFAAKHGVSQIVEYERFYNWFESNQKTIEELYERHKAGEQVSDEIPPEILSYLGMSEDKKIIPIYRLKIPSSLNAATQEPEGIDKILNFLKFVSILGGRTMFMDESTRTAPRSIECLYNVLNRRVDELGGVTIRLFGKINGVRGGSGTLLTERLADKSQLEIALIDPWQSEVKPVNDDSVGFVPEISGAGVVEVIRTPYTSISPFGISNIQEFWKQLISGEVASRFESFSSSLSEKIEIPGNSKREEVLLPDEILSQEQLREKSFSQSYKALVIDLDGTTGLRGIYHRGVIERIKELAEQGTDVVIATARSQVDYPEYSGSVASLIGHLGELSAKQRSHIFLGTENCAVIAGLDLLDKPVINYNLSQETAVRIEELLQVSFPALKSYRENGSIVIRGFHKEDRGNILSRLQAEIDRSAEEGMDLGVKLEADAPRSIHIRVKASSKRNALDWLESRGISLDQIAKIGDSPEGNDRAMLLGLGSFNVGLDRGGTLWTIHMEDAGGGPEETARLLKKLKFIASE